MSKIEKLIGRLKTRPRDFTWDELSRLLNFFGYVEIAGAGSRRKFMRDRGHVIMLHEPHPRKVLKGYQVDQVFAVLCEEGLI